MITGDGDKRKALISIHIFMGKYETFTIRNHPSTQMNIRISETRKCCGDGGRLIQIICADKLHRKAKISNENRFGARTAPQAHLHVMCSAR